MSKILKIKGKTGGLSLSSHFLTSLKHLWLLVSAVSQYLYDEEEEVRKKKPRRKLPSNAAITRVRKISPHPSILPSLSFSAFFTSLPVFVLQKQFAANLLSNFRVASSSLSSSSSSSFAPPALVPLCWFSSLNPFSPPSSILRVIQSVFF